MKYNMIFRSKHVAGAANYVSDKLFHFKLQEARQWAPWLSSNQCVLPTELLHI